MHHGKYEKRRRNPIGFILLAFLAVLSMGVGGTVAYLSASRSLENSFQVSPNPTVVVNDNYSISVTADYSVYVRASVVVTWQDENNHILGQVPEEGKDYSIVWNWGSDNAANTEDDPWFQGDGGFWYCKTPITSEATPTLISSFSNLTQKDGYTLCVEVLAQAIQAIGTTDRDDIKAVVDAWNVDPRASGNNGN